MTHCMVCTSVHGPDDCCWHIPFALWVHGNGLASLRHNLHVRTHPFQAPQHPLDELVLGRFGKNALGGSDTLWCVPLSIELIIAAGMFNLPCGCITMDWQAWGVTCASGCIPFRPHSTYWMGCTWADLAKMHRTEMTHCAVCPCPRSR